VEGLEEILLKLSNLDTSDERKADFVTSMMVRFEHADSDGDGQVSFSGEFRTRRVLSFGERSISPRESTLKKWAILLQIEFYTHFSLKTSLPRHHLRVKLEMEVFRRRSFPFHVL